MRRRLSGAFAVALAYAFIVSAALGASALSAHAGRIASSDLERCQSGPDKGADQTLCAALCQIAGTPALTETSPAPVAPAARPMPVERFATVSPAPSAAIDAAARGPPVRA